jgi:flagellar hook-associated protein FlgK
MSGIGINTGLRALLATRFALDTAGHNISNAATPGYSRQNVDFSAAHPVFSNGSFVGSGVEALSVRRSADGLLHRRILGQGSVLGSLNARHTGLSEMEDLFNEPANGLGGLMNGWFAKVSDLSASPEDDILRTGLVSAGEDLGGQFRQLRGQMDDLRTSFAGQLESKVAQVNQLATSISNLNREIGKSELGGAAANDLRDARDEALRSLSELVDIRAIEDSKGITRVLVAGSLLVDSGSAHELTLDQKSDGSAVLHIDGVTSHIPIEGGSMGGLYDLYQERAPAHIQHLDKVAHELIREVNRVHATGVPKSGPFKSITGSYRIQDKDADGELGDALLSNAGLPFEVVSGELNLNVSDSNGNLSKHKLSISATHTTVQDFVDQLNEVPHVSAEVDALGRMRISTEAGYGFDFSRRLDPHPDDAGTFGGGQASLGSSAGPFALADGDTLTLSVGSGGGAVSTTVTLSQADFDAIGAATADELADVINADPGVLAAGMQAVALDGALFLQTTGTGTAATFSISGGSIATALGWSALVGTPIDGATTAVNAEVSGSYTGDDNSRWTFRPNMDGTIGTTPGLKVEVFDPSGAKIATLDVGAGYQPGQKLQVAEGVSVGFGIGGLSATNNDALVMDVVGQPDTSDVLVALGLNGFFTGTDASTIDVREDLRNDPDLIAASATGAIGDASVLLSLLDVQTKASEELQGNTINGSYGDLVGGVGFEVGTAASAMDANQTLLDSLQLRREEVSGVNVDEEMVHVMQLEQAYTAAVQYISTLNQLQDDLINLL